MYQEKKKVESRCSKIRKILNPDTVADPKGFGPAYIRMW